MSQLQAKHQEQYKRLKDSTEITNATLVTVSGGTFRKRSPQRATTITDILVEFMARDLRPLRLVDGSGFKKLMGYIEPG